MGFSIKRIKDFEAYVLDELQKAEKSGLDRVIIPKPNMMEYEDIIGQIFDYKHKWNDEDENDLPLKNAWRLIGGKPHTVREKRYGGHIQDEAGELILEKVEGDYLPQKDKFISQREVEAKAEELGKGLWKQGKFLINKSGDYGRIKLVGVTDVKDRDLTHHCPLTNPHEKYIPMDGMVIVVEYEYEKRIDVNNPVFDKEQQYSFDGETFGKFEQEWTVIEEGDLVGFERKVIEAKETGTLIGFGEQLMIGTSEDQKMSSDMGEGSTALMGMSNQDQLQLMHDRIYKKNQLSKAVQYSFVRVITLKREELDLILAKEKEKMEVMKEELKYQIAVFEKQMKKIQRLIVTLELYLGEGENVVQIAEGRNAPEDEKIALRQMMLYMDEEFGDTSNGGLDFRTIEEFDAWLVDSGNFERVLPNPKGVVVMRPRRNMKRYEELGNGMWASMQRAQFQAWDKKFYILIRNGENLYKIETEHIEMGTRLFPLRAELQEMMDMVAEGSLKMEEEEIDSYAWRQAEEKMEKGNDRIFSYQRTFLLLQGIIMRTPIFTPIPAEFNILNVETHEGIVNFIYDEENILMDGRVRFNDWQKQINETIVKGSRVVLTDGYTVRDYDNRFNGYISDGMRHSLRTPSAGVYSVKSRIIEREAPKYIYMSLKEWQEIEREQEIMKAKHKSVDGDGHFKKVSYNFPEGYYLKYERGHYRRKEGGEEMVQLYLLNKDGSKTYETQKTEQFYVSYTYPHPYTDKIQKKTFVIDPENDHQILNYDALLLEDLDYYINSRIDRPNYLHMLPVLREQRKEILAEQKAEENFVTLTKSELLREYPDLAELDIETLIYDGIEWWKNKKATVWKRPIAKDDSKALEMILQHVKKACKKRGKNVNTGTDYRESLLVWRIDNFLFYGLGLTKKDFAEQVKAISERDYIFNHVTGFSKCINEVRGVRVPRAGLQTELWDSAEQEFETVQYKIY